MVEFLLFVALLGALSSIVFWSVLLGISPMPSLPKTARKIAWRVKQYPQPVVVELGSGWGTLALCIAKHNPTKQVVAYERSYVPYVFSLLLQALLRTPNVTFKNANFLTHAFTDGQIGVAYLCPRSMRQLEEHWANEGFPAVLLSATFALRGMKPTQTLKPEGVLDAILFEYTTFNPAVLELDQKTDNEEKK